MTPNTDQTQGLQLLSIWQPTITATRLTPDPKVFHYLFKDNR
jgi:hypothetical protein